MILQFWNCFLSKFKWSNCLLTHGTSLHSNKIDLFNSVAYIQNTVPRLYSSLDMIGVKDTGQGTLPQWTWISHPQNIPEEVSRDCFYKYLHYFLFDYNTYIWLTVFCSHEVNSRDGAVMRNYPKSTILFSMVLFKFGN